VTIGLDQTFGNLTWDCANQTVSNNPGSILKVSGDLTIENTGEGALEFSSGTSTVDGSYFQTGGAVKVGDGSAQTLEISDNFSLSGGTFYIGSGGTVAIQAAESSQPSRTSQPSRIEIKWWLIGGIAGIIMALAIWILVRWIRLSRY
jgi:hypothetical protein